MSDTATANGGDVTRGVSGWFKKAPAGRRGKSHRRFFVVDDAARTLSYYTDETCTSQKGRVGLVEVQRVDRTDRHLVIETPSRRYVLEADEEEVAAQVADALTQRLGSLRTIKKKSDWTSDKEAPTCTLCDRRFTVTFRRHHCRFCGDVMCGDCAPGRKTMALKKKRGLVRCCYECFADLCPEAPGLEKEREQAKQRQQAVKDKAANVGKLDTDATGDGSSGGVGGGAANGRENAAATAAGGGGGGVSDDADDDATEQGMVECDVVLTRLWGTGLTRGDLELAFAPYGRLISVGGDADGIESGSGAVRVDREDSIRVRIIERTAGALPVDCDFVVGGHALGISRQAVPTAPTAAQDGPSPGDDPAVDGDLAVRRLLLVGVPPVATFGDVRLGLAAYGRVDSLNGVEVDFNGVFQGPGGDGGAVGLVPRSGHHEVTLVLRKGMEMPDATSVSIGGATVRVTSFPSPARARRLSFTAPGADASLRLGELKPSTPPEAEPRRNSGVYEFDLDEEENVGNMRRPSGVYKFDPEPDGRRRSSGVYEFDEADVELPVGSASERRPSTNPFGEYHTVGPTPESVGQETTAVPSGATSVGGSAPKAPATNSNPFASNPFASTTHTAPTLSPVAEGSPNQNDGLATPKASEQPGADGMLTPQPSTPQAATDSVARSDAPSTPLAPGKAAPKVASRPQVRSRAKDKTKHALEWCQEMAKGTGISIQNFSKDFGSGLAFCAIMKGVFPDKIDMSTLSAENRAENFELAFRVAEEGGQERFLDVEDCIEMPYPDKLAVMTYVFELQRRFGK